ncbi:hypothetical protein [Acinetobacter gerneri]|uniref:hypothetical protein n=1 Tax=Acinetobacter gerneri TaxID=202952 RepID=UPI003A878E1C
MENDVLKTLFKVGLSVIAFCMVGTIQAETLTKNALTRYDYENDIFHPIRAKNGMVASEQEIASQIGVAILD